MPSPIIVFETVACSVYEAEQKSFERLSTTINYNTFPIQVLDWLLLQLLKREPNFGNFTLYPWLLISN